MPEYLAPGVYVEEIDTGSKPIEGVSTSTAGMIGVTERGPGQCSHSHHRLWRIHHGGSGGRLNIGDFSDAATGHHCYLPHAVEGFFTNGGKRVYITRVLNLPQVQNAEMFLFDRGTPTTAATPAPPSGGRPQ